MCLFWRYLIWVGDSFAQIRQQIMSLYHAPHDRAVLANDEILKTRSEFEWPAVCLVRLVHLVRFFCF
ncbi:MAG: hypothetical protein MPJ78_02980, partial [Hyphomicrobiaceae bacterium]|nr:hypothetical protein [Hyphomicrobiaceae bacterium]